MRALSVLMFTILIKCVYPVCKNQKCLGIDIDIELQKETIADLILSKYGDVAAEFKTILQMQDMYMTTGNQKLKNQEELTQTLFNRENDLHGNTSKLFKQLEDLHKNLNLSFEDINLNNSEPQIIDNSILNKIRNIEYQLTVMNTLYDHYNETNLYDRIMNIPHSVSEDISFFEKLLNEDKNASCVNSLQKELNKLFKELSTLLNFDGIVQDIGNLTQAANDKDEQETAILQVIQGITKKETEAMEMSDLLNILDDVLTDLKQILDDLNIKKLSEIDLFIEKTEKEIEDYSNEIVCYIKYFENCHIKSASDSFIEPECMKIYQDMV